MPHRDSHTVALKFSYQIHRADYLHGAFEQLRVVFRGTDSCPAVVRYFRDRADRGGDLLPVSLLQTYPLSDG